jgi:Zn-dependent protease with chaperone function
MLRRLAAEAHVAVRGLEVGGKASRKVARVERRRDGFWVVFQPRMLDAPEPARLFVLAHEVAHIAMGHRRIRRRLGFALIAVIPLASVGFGLVLGLQIVRDANPWLLLVESALWLTVILSPRAILLALARRGEYQADRMAVRLLGSPDGAVAFFDWAATLKPYVMPLPLRLWGSTHPSNATRRRVLLGGAR